MYYSDNEIESLIKDVGKLFRRAPDGERFAALRSELIRHTFEHQVEALERGSLAPRLPFLFFRRAAVTMLITIILLGTGTVLAAQQSLPGEPLYPLKREFEEITLHLTPSAQGKAERLLEYAQRRVQELQEMQGSDASPRLLAEVAEDYSDLVAQAGSLTARIESVEDRAQLVVAIMKEVTRDQEIVNRYGAVSSEMPESQAAQMTEPVAVAQVIAQAAQVALEKENKTDTPIYAELKDVMSETSGDDSAWVVEDSGSLPQIKEPTDSVAPPQGSEGTPIVADENINTVTFNTSQIITSSEGTASTEVTEETVVSTYSEQSSTQVIVNNKNQETTNGERAPADSKFNNSSSFTSTTTTSTLQYLPSQNILATSTSSYPTTTPSFNIPATEDLIEATKSKIPTTSTTTTSNDFIPSFVHPDLPVY